MRPEPSAVTPRSYRAGMVTWTLDDLPRLGYWHRRAETERRRLGLPCVTVTLPPRTAYTERQALTVHADGTVTISPPFRRRRFAYRYR